MTIRRTTDDAPASRERVPGIKIRPARTTDALGRAARTVTYRRTWLPIAMALAAVLLAAGCSVPEARWQDPQPSRSGQPSPAQSSSQPPGGTDPGAQAAQACVSSMLGQMTLTEIAGQVMLVGTPVSDPASVLDTIAKYHVGGVFLAGRSKARAARLKAAIAGLQAAAGTSNRLFIALDQEGGEVQTLQGPDFPPIPTAVDQGKLDQAVLGDQTQAWAQRLADIGVNLDLAPVADTVPASLGTKNPPIGLYHRQYGSDPERVADDIAIVVPAIQGTGVVTALKHFPGLGRTRVNTDFSTGAKDSVTTPSDPYLDPFIAGIRAGTGAVMISSATYPKLDPDHIAAFSEPIITGLLRDDFGFNGLIISDSLSGAAAVSDVPTKLRAVRFIRAGGDFALVTQEAKAPTMINGLTRAAQASAGFRDRLTNAAGRVLRAKYAAGLLACAP